MDIDDTLILGIYSVNITGFTTERVKANAWGFNVGADATWMLHTNVGIGGTLRYIRATVEMKDVLASTDDDQETMDFKAGGTVAAFGVKFFFGGK